MKKDTLLFFLPKREGNWKENEIFEEIYNQKINFIKQFDYEPKYISIKNDIVDYLFKNINLKVINAINIHYPKIVFGMKIKLRDDDLGLYNNEVICI